MRLAWFGVIVGLLVLGEAGCGDDDGTGGPADGGTGPDGGGTVEPPPERCADFTAPGPGPSFRDATADWELDALGGRVSSADLDGDGYPDLVVHVIGNHNRADFTTEPRTWPYRVLMNRTKSGGGRHFVDQTVESGYGVMREPVADTGHSAQFAIFADVDNDGDVDAYSGTYSDPTNPDTDPGDRSRILLNDGDGVFSLGPTSPLILGSEDGFRQVTTSAASFLDHDRDGILDLFVGYWYSQYGRSLYGTQDRLGRGTGGGSFEDVTDAVGLGTLGRPGDRDESKPTYGVTACDVDADGDTDLLVSAYGRRWNQLWLRTEDGYVDVGETSGFDGDDLTDYSDSEFYKCFCQSTGSCEADPPRISCGSIYWNEGVDDQPFRLNGNTFTTACGDVDADGDMDLYNAEIVHWHVGSSSDSSQLLVNEGTNEDGIPTFTRPGNEATGLEVPHVGTSWNEGGIVSGLGDLDNDGRMDVLLGTSDYPDQKLWIYRQGADGTFEETAVAAGVDHACAPGFSMADFDRDGDMDLVVATSTARDCSDIWTEGPEVRFYENIGGQDANWTQVVLEGVPEMDTNRSAVGALIRVTAGGVTQTREVQAGYGTFGMQHDLVQSFGLGESCAIESIEVVWPDANATTTRYTDVRGNYRVRIHQAEGLSYLTD